MEKDEILRSYGLTASHLWRLGMEAEVYVFGDDAVLKLYNESTPFAHLLALQDFYNRLDRSSLSYSLPNIKRIENRSRYTIVIEERLAGRPLSELIAELRVDHCRQLDQHCQVYLTAVAELSQLRMPSDVSRYKLFDADDVSLCAAGDWHHFLLRYLDEKLRTVEVYFASDVLEYQQKVRCIKSALATRYDGLHCVIHGDFAPGNLLIDDAGQPTALLDFGLFTMYGDPVFDLATAWVFFDMYDELQANIRERLLAMILERFGERQRERLYRYLLLYSFLSANTYSSQCTDGHYEWCVANLNRREYWKYLM